MNTRFSWIVLACCLCLFHSGHLYGAEEGKGRKKAEGKEEPSAEETLNISADEPYRHLLENSPFLTLEFKQQLGNARNRGVANLQFVGYAWADGQWLFALQNRRNRESKWLPLGESFDNARLIRFDEAERVLTINAGGSEIQLRLQP